MSSDVLVSSVFKATLQLPDDSQIEVSKKDIFKLRFELSEALKKIELMEEKEFLEKNLKLF